MSQLTVTSDNFGPLVQVINAICLAWILVAVCGRVATKVFVVRKLATDDGLTLCCLAFAIGQSVAIAVASQYGLGQHEDALSAAHLEIVQKSVYAAELLFVPSMVFAKLAVLFTLLSLTPVKSQRIAIHLVSGIVILWAITAEFAVAFQCRAPQTWDWSQASCLNKRAIATYTAVGNLVTELALILVPCVIIGNLKTEISRRTKILVTFMLRILAVAAIATQLAYIRDASNTDLSFVLWRDVLCTQSVQCVVVLCTCFVYLRPYLEWLESGFLRVDDLRRKVQKGYATDRSFSVQSTPADIHQLRERQHSQHHASKTSISNHPQPGEGSQADSIDRKDKIALMRLGKLPSLKRKFGFMPSLGFSCSLLITWEGVNVLFVSGLNNGGPAGVIYGYLFLWLGNFSVFMTLSEMVSMAPISSGQYHWVSMLAPYKWHKFLSYLTGWFTLVGWQANVASGAFLSGTMIQGLIVLTDDSYNFRPWHGTLLFWATIVFAVFINTVVSSALPKFEGFLLVLHVAGFFAILIPLVVLGPHGDAKDVFTTFINAGNWPTQGLSFFVGLLGNVFAFFGADGAIHMSEEIRNAPVVVPRSMLSAIVINGALGFAMLLGLLFCLGDPAAAIASPTGYPYMEVFYQAVQSTAGAAIMASFIVTMAICATIAILASSSRVLWAFARDRAVPGWRYLQKLDPRTSIPVLAVAATTIVSFLLALIIIGSSTAFNDIVGLTVAGVYGSYLIAAILLLWRRCRGDIHMAGEDATTLVNVAGKELVWGPWRIPGFLGILNNAFTCCFLLIIWFFSFWPPATPPEASTMNYNVLMLGATAIFSVLYYLFAAQKVYTGPCIETEN